MVLFAPVRIVLAALPIVAMVVITARVLPSPGAVPGPASSLVSLAWGVAALLLYAGFVRLVEQRRAEELGSRGAVAEVGLGFAIGAALFALTMAILLLAGIAHVGRGDGVRALVVGLGVAVGAALLEETLLRAIFFRIVEDRLGTWTALALSAALFGVLHAFSPGATVISTAAIALEAGVILAAAYAFSRRLWLPIGLHAAWNFTEGGVFGASVSGTRPYGLVSSHFSGPALLSGGAFGPEASIVAVLVCLSAGVALIAVARRRGHVMQPSWRR
ncbi:MAG: type II CAAX endopeptidase family protein [Kofleriaceae bacterium]